MVQTRATGRPFPGWGTSDNKIAAIWIALAMVTSLTIGGVIGLSNVDSWLYINSSTWVNGSMNISEDLFVNGNITANYYYGDGSNLSNVNFTESDPYWLANYSDFLTISAWNDTGLIRDWNSTGLIINWSGNYLTSESDPLWTGNQSSYFTSAQILGFSYYNSTDFDIADYLLISNWNSTNESYYLITNPFGFYNSTNPQVELDPKWSANYSTFLTKITWAEVMNGTLFKTSQWNATNTSYALESMLNNGSYFNYPWNATNTSYYLRTNPFGFYNITSFPDNYMLNTGDTATGDYTFDTSTLKIDATNHRVGIGTSTPNAKLEIDNNVAWQLSSLATSISPNIAFRIRGRNTAVATMAMGSMNTLDYAIQGVNDAGDAGTNIAINPWGGNVGIGTTNPGYNLEVNSAATTKFRLTNDDFVSGSAGTALSVLTGATTGNTYVRFQTANAGVSAGDLVLQTGGGNVGIGTTTPGEKLEVVGNINSTGGNICITGGNCLSGTSYWSCPGVHFDAQNPSAQIVSKLPGGILLANDNNIIVVASVFLPHGATITNVTVMGNDAAEAETWTLKRMLLSDSTSQTVMATAAINTADTTISSGVIDNSLYSYHLYTSSIDTDDAINGATITYTI